MTEKIEIVCQLGEKALLLPGLLSGALSANDRLKLRLTLLQEAVAHARDQSRPAPSFEAERRAADLADAQYDATITGARAVGADRIVVPGAKPLLAGLRSDLDAMLAPLQDAATEEFVALSRRLTALAARLPAADNDELTVDAVKALTAAGRGGADSVHLLVMDAHKAINRLAVDTAVETIDGAHAYHLEAADRVHVRAFMAGLNRTAPLAFGHPGLGTTATHSTAGLTIQNDIGATDAHVLVVHVADNAATVTYTDIHRRRAKFFMSLFEGQGVTWSALAEHDAHGLEQEQFYFVTGRFAGEDVAALDRFLEFLGSRIVFLIDWNKARKALQTFVDRNAAEGILAWAAAHDYGHRAFLELGGTDLVHEAVRRMPSGRIPYGVRLDQALGPSDSASFLRRVLRQTGEGLRAARSARLIRDEVQADLAQLFDTAEATTLTVLVRHLGVTRMLAAAIGETLAADQSLAQAERPALALKAKRLEEKADRLTVQARESCARIQHAAHLLKTVDEIENATDALDEGAFLLSLAPHGPDPTDGSALADLAAIVIDSVGHLVRAVEAASRLPQGQHIDTEDSLQAIDAVLDAERRADTAERDAFRDFMRAPRGDARPLVLGLEVARALETATDHLAHAGLALRDRVLEELSA